LANCAEKKFRDPGQAVQLAQRAVELAPQEGGYRNTLGAAAYRAGQWRAAIDALNESMKRREGGDSTDWFFLAMARWQLGEKEQAVKWFDKAVAWMDKNDPKGDDLLRFRAEAAEVLGIKEPSKPELPAPPKEIKEE